MPLRAYAPTTKSRHVQFFLQGVDLVLTLRNFKAQNCVAIIHDFAYFWHCCVGQHLHYGGYLAVDVNKVWHFGGHLFSTATVLTYCCSGLQFVNTLIWRNQEPVKYFRLAFSKYHNKSANEHTLSAYRSHTVMTPLLLYTEYNWVLFFLKIITIVFIIINLYIFKVNLYFPVKDVAWTDITQNIIPH